MLNVVLVGAGGISKSHIAAWLKQDNARVIGVADFFGDRVFLHRSFGTEFNFMMNF